MSTGRAEVAGKVAATADTALNATQASLLGFLHEGPMTGWDLLQQVESGLARFWNITSSHVYRELRVLEERRLVRAGSPGVRDRVPFSITAAGRRAFGEWINRPPGSEQMRFPLLVTLWFGRHLQPDALARFVAAAREEHGQRLDLYESALRADHPGSAAGEDGHRREVVRFGIAYERAILDWLDGITV
jgi:DNA-binding PadR family transcriptional regulator